MAVILWVALILILIENQNHIEIAEAYSGTPDLVGVCYGTQGRNIPDLRRTVSLLKNYGIKKIRIKENYSLESLPDATNSSDLFVAIDVDNEALDLIVLDNVFRKNWFEVNVNGSLILDQLTHIVVGVNAIPGPHASSIEPAMEALQSLLEENNLQNEIKLTTLVNASVLTTTYPPSIAAFTSQSRNDITMVLRHLGFINSPLMLSVFNPYYDYASGKIQQDFATFTAHSAVIYDGHYGYWNMFDLVVDSFSNALEKLEYADQINLIIGETGWPTAGNGEFTTPALAATYNQNFLRHITSGQGTPRNPNVTFDGFIYSVYNEQSRGPGAEQYFGMFYLNQKPVYHLYFPKGPWGSATSADQALRINNSTDHA